MPRNMNWNDYVIRLLEGLRSIMGSIKDTDGIKKITDELPAGTQEIGKVRLTDGTYDVTATVTGNKVRLDVSSTSGQAYSQAYSDTSKVEVNHALGQFPSVRVYENVRGTAFGAGGFGVSGAGLSGGALPDEVVDLTIGFVLFYVDDDNFTVLFPTHRGGGFVEWREV